MNIKQENLVPGQLLTSITFFKVFKTRCDKPFFCPGDINEKDLIACILIEPPKRHFLEQRHISFVHVAFKKVAKQDTHSSWRNAKVFLIFNIQVQEMYPCIEKKRKNVKFFLYKMSIRISFWELLKRPSISVTALNELSGSLMIRQGTASASKRKR